MAPIWTHNLNLFGLPALALTWAKRVGENSHLLGGAEAVKTPYFSEEGQRHSNQVVSRPLMGAEVTTFSCNIL